MAEREDYIPGVPCWIDTSHPDPEAAAAFYGGLFGWELENVMPPEAGDSYFIGRLRGGDVAGIGSLPAEAPAIAAWNTYVWVDSANQTATLVTAAGGTVLREPFDVMDAGRMAVFADPEGAVFSVWEAKQHRGARIVNEHGSLNFNGLNTGDLEGAKAFYGAVFGWQTVPMGSGAYAWTLPGYGDHLEQHDPDLRNRMADAGAPPGFEDVVATLNPIPPEQPDVSAHWTVTFAVDDADAVAAEAAKLGATVIMPPVDAPWVRITVLADPQGATFIANKFVPENRDLAVAETASPPA
jgi:hypothetical protein